MSAAAKKICAGVLLEKTGDASALALTDSLPVPAPTGTEMLVRNRAAGVNYIDIYHRTGVYPIPLPAVLGREAAGEVVAVGEAVKDFKIGDRVLARLSRETAGWGGRGCLLTCVFSTGSRASASQAYISPGTYAEYSLASEDKAVLLTPQFSFVDGAAAMLQGLTALSLVREAYRVREGDWVLVHAAAGGTGLMLTQMAVAYGARVIGTTSSDEKAALARKAGCEHVVVYTRDDVVAEVGKITGGMGVHVVYDGVGKSTFDASLACVRRLGSLVSFGNASGVVEPFAIGRLSQNNARLLRPTLMNYVTTKEEFRALADELWTLIIEKSVRLTVHKVYQLKDVAQAHRDLESRATTGKLVLEI
ncbi:MAG: hypothetical protein BJ554DRAFT_7053 [Olpidium bornovanus]|uniref:Probable quinone oxidoreductase n=1 Tax=Olpidium bornovanus TaxID=278681 RepID=A0A8H7ZX55_9FUNG|nr:MAG: hypothetical protein BJ554DRAFT_7053 [Olpidium bornovanus]